jgi:hypothetical protein
VTNTNTTADYWDSSPKILDVPYDARWYLFVDGYDGRITAYRKARRSAKN